MKISPLQENKQLYFTSNCREVIDAAGKVTNRNSTRFMRCDLKWRKFTEHIIEKYKNKNKVNVYCYACSDGSEPYSLAMMLISKLGKEKAQKFFPIIAKDIDGTFLTSAQKGIVKLDQYDIEEIEKKTHLASTAFITTDSNYEKFHGMDLCTGKISDLLKGTVTFEQANIMHDIKNVKKHNSIIMFRNVWPYLSETSQHELAKNITKQLGRDSMLVIGGWDDKMEIGSKVLTKHGLKSEDIEYCYESVSLKSKALLSDPQYMMQVFAGK